MKRTSITSISFFVMGLFAFVSAGYGIRNLACERQSDSVSVWATFASADPLDGKVFTDPTEGKLFTDPTDGKEITSPTGGPFIY